MGLDSDLVHCSDVPPLMAGQWVWYDATVPANPLEAASFEIPPIPSNVPFSPVASCHHKLLTPL